MAVGIRKISFGLVLGICIAFLLQRNQWHLNSDPLLYIMSNMTDVAQLPSRIALDLLATRRLNGILERTTGTKASSRWSMSLDDQGRWPGSEIDYTSGCEARRANWPATQHLSRTLAMAVHWLQQRRGGGNETALRDAVSRAVGFWLRNDYGNDACLDQGGTSACPCGTPGFWNTNWFPNVIRVSQLIGQICLVLGDTLNQAEHYGCERICKRSFNVLADGVSRDYLAGANIIDIASIAVNLGIFTQNAAIVAEAYRYAHQVVRVQDQPMVDGIRPDGGFRQHGLLYNGNYGKDCINAFFALELDAAGTAFSAGTEAKRAFTDLLISSQWMIFQNTLTGSLHWDLSALGRFISFPVADKQATSGIKLDLAQIRLLAEHWDSQELLALHESLTSGGSGANSGSLAGNRMFFDNDYMVHRSGEYVITLKMLSTRTINSECLNSQNPLGFHLSDGVLRTYIVGNEYEDIAAAWDWHLIPGITVDYAKTPLSCDQTTFSGLEAFVGGVSNGSIGMAVMKYTNPLTQAFSWQKAWFFLPGDRLHVVVSNVTSLTDAPVYSVLEQSRHNGDVLVDGLVRKSGAYTGAKTLWHAGVGYRFEDHALALSIAVEGRTGDWSSIGISKAPPVTVPLVSAWLAHLDHSPRKPTAYTVFPGRDYETFRTASDVDALETSMSNEHVSAVLDDGYGIVMIALWDAEAAGDVAIGSVVRWGPAPVSVKADKPILLMVDKAMGSLTVADPSHVLRAVSIWFSHAESGETLATLAVELPGGGLAGSSVSRALWDDDV